MEKDDNVIRYLGHAFKCAVSAFVVTWALPATLHAQTQGSDPQEKEAKAPAEVRQKLSEFRAEIERKVLNFGVGYTEAMNQPRSTLLGDLEDPSQNVEWRSTINRNANALLSVDQSARTTFLLKNPDARRTLPDIKNNTDIACNATASAFDWRVHGKVTTVKHQTCGNCWAFAATAALESSYLIVNNMTSDESEQYINDCGKTDKGAKAGSCDGGLAANALQHFVRVGQVTETTDEYTGKDSACANPLPEVHALAWAFVDPAVEHPSRENIKQALCNHGPLATRMRIVSDMIFSYKSGVYNESVSSDDQGGGHAVLIVGWDDTKDAWLIKNSWDTDWGPESGFGWIGYSSNRIGRHSAWVRAVSTHYPVANLGAIKERVLLNKPIPEDLLLPFKTDVDGTAGKKK